MEISVKIVYRTSKGTFWNLRDAMKKENRAKEFGSRPGDGSNYEQPQQAYVLVVDGYQFEMKEIDIK